MKDAKSMKSLLSALSLSGRSKTSRDRRRPSNGRRLSGFERLEARRLLATWIGPEFNGSWFSKANWNTGSIPDASSDVVISNAYVLLPANAVVRSLRLNSATVNRHSSIEGLEVLGSVALTGFSSAQTSKVAGPVSVSGEFGSVSGTITGPVTVSEGAQFRFDTIKDTTISLSGTPSIHGKVLSGVSISGDFSIDNRFLIEVQNDLTINGDITINVDAPQSGFVYHSGLWFNGSQMLLGSGTIQLNSESGLNAVLDTSNASVLTIGAGVTIRGSGEIGSLQHFLSRQIVSSGRIIASSNGVLTIAATLTNQGRVEVEANGMLQFVTIESGIISGASGARLASYGLNQTLKATTLEGELLIQSLVKVVDSLTVNGLLRIEGRDRPNSAVISCGLSFSGVSPSLNGTGAVAMASGVNSPAILWSTSNATFVINDVHVSGDGEIGVAAAGGSARVVNIINNGTIEANSPARTLAITIGGGPVAGSGSINLGRISVANGARLNIADTLTNDGELSVDGTSSLQFIEIAMGTINTTANALLIGGTLNGVTIEGDFVIDERRIGIKNNLTLNGIATIKGSSGNVNRVIYQGFVFTGSQELKGKGTIQLTSTNNFNIPVVAVSTGSLSIANGFTIQGHGYVGHIAPISSGHIDSASVDNSGKILATESGKTLFIIGANHANAGSIKALNGARVQLGGLLTNLEEPTSSGALFVDSTSSLQFTEIASGTITVSEGGRLVGSGTLRAVTLKGVVLLQDTLIKVRSGLTLNGTLIVNGTRTSGSNLWGLQFEESQSFRGNARVILDTTPSNFAVLSVSNGATLTLGYGPDEEVPPNTTVIVSGSGTVGQTSLSGSSPVRVLVSEEGVLRADVAGERLTVTGTGNINSGTLLAELGGRLDFYGDSRTDHTRFIRSDGDVLQFDNSIVFISGNLLGNTQASQEFVNSGEVILHAGTQSSPRLLEAMSFDYGPNGADPNGNFYYDSLTLSASTYVRIVDADRNTDSGRDTNPNLPEVVYVGTLRIGSGARLDLNGLNVYASQVISQGTIVGGTIFPIPPNFAPTDVLLSSDEIRENNQPSTVIGTLTSVDPNPGSRFRYSLVDGAGSDDNATFSISTDSLIARVAFDFERKSIYSIRLRTTDQWGAFFEKSFTIKVLDAIEPPAPVTTTNDSGAGSLRQAILDANSNPGVDIIRFDLGGSLLRISPQTPLPLITDPVVIDGTTQPGYQGKPLIEINGANAGIANGLRIVAGGSTVRGLVINDFALNGLVLSVGGNNVVEGSYIGTTLDGTAAAGNLQNGLLIESGSSNNRIGTDANGVADEVERNLISGNGGSGVVVRGATTQSNTIAGNYVGTGIDGLISIPNGFAGIHVYESAQLTTVGGASDAAGNVIAFNVGAGLLVPEVPVVSITTIGNRFRQNGIGVDLGEPGATPNDSGDADGVRNAPVITSSRIEGSSLVLEGFARPGTVFDLYETANYANGFGQGERYLITLTEGSAGDVNSSFGSYGPSVNGVNVGSDITNRFRFVIPLSILPAGVGVGTRLTSIAVGPSSEFSAISVIAPPTPSGQVFYKNSGFTGAAAMSGASKSVLRATSATQVTSFANVSNYAKGINGIVLDIPGLLATSLSVSDFIFRVAPQGASGLVNPNAWASAPTPTLIDVTPGNSATPARVRVEWDDSAIQNTWLQVIVNANANTGLASREVFYLGHAYGEVDGVAPYRVSTLDVGRVRAAVGNAIVSVSDVRDIDKDRRITTTDVGLLRARVSNSVVLNNITIPAEGTIETSGAMSVSLATPGIANQTTMIISAFPAPATSKHRGLAVTGTETTSDHNENSKSIAILTSSLNMSDLFGASEKTVQFKAVPVAIAEHLSQIDSFFSEFENRVKRAESFNSFPLKVFVRRPQS